MLDQALAVIDMAGALLDDPAHNRFSPDYMMPFVDFQHGILDTDLQVLGMQNVEQIAIFNIPVGTSDLTPYFAPGQPLQSFKMPKILEWKQQGMPDTMYGPSALVDRLDDVTDASLGAYQYRWSKGVLAVTPSAVPLTLRVTFQALSVNVWDPAQQVVRGTGHILAARVALIVCASNNGMGTMQTRVALEEKRAWSSFKSAIVMTQQRKNRVPPTIRGAKRSTYTGPLAVP